MRFTRSFPTHEEKVENNKKVYLEHLRENGVLGNLKLADKERSNCIGESVHMEYTQIHKKCSGKNNLLMTWLVGKNPVCSEHICRLTI